MKGSLTSLQENLGYVFKNQKLLQQALTPQTALNPRENNERLEFLGDRVLGLALADLLQTFLPNASVGELNEAFIKYARNDAKLSSLGTEYKLAQYTGKSGTKGLADAMEALIGAVFIDSKRDYSLAKAFIAKHWAIELGLPTREILPFYIIKKYNDEQLIEGFLRLGLNPNSVLSLEGEYKKEYSKLKAQDFHQEMRGALQDIIGLGFGSSDDFGGVSISTLIAEQAKRNKAEKMLQDKFKIPTKELSDLIDKSLIEIACTFQRSAILDILVNFGAVIDKRCTSNVLGQFIFKLERFLDMSDSDYDNQIRDEIELKYATEKEFATGDLKADEVNYWALYKERTKFINQKIEREIAKAIIKRKSQDLDELMVSTKFVHNLFQREKIEINAWNIQNSLYSLHQITTDEYDLKKLNLYPGITEILSELKTQLFALLEVKQSTLVAKDNEEKGDRYNKSTINIENLEAIKTKISGVLAKVSDLAMQEKWDVLKESDHTHKGILAYLQDDYLKNKLQDYANDNNVNLARLLCFQAINIAAASRGNFNMSLQFSGAYPQLVEKATNNIEFFCTEQVNRECFKVMQNINSAQLNSPNANERR